MKSKILSLCIAGSLFAGNLGAAESEPIPAPAPAEKTAPKAAPAPAASPAPVKAPEAVQAMARDFGKKTDDRLAKQKAYRERLNAAKTDEERQKIIAEMRTQHRQQLERQREIAREQLQNRRRSDSGVGIAVGP